MERALKIMSKNLIVINEGESLLEAQRLMKENNLRHLPVTTSDGCIVGLLSDRDLQRASRSEIVESGVRRWEVVDFDPNHTVNDFMSWPVKTVDVRTSISVVAEMLLKEKVSSYLVTEDGVVAGIITTDDLLKYLVKILKSENTTWRESLVDLFSVDKAGRYAQTLADAGI
jgi:CBS domain-containing membrane protein